MNTVKKNMGCEAKINGEVLNKGALSIEFYKYGKAQYYCRGYVSNSTEELIETCNVCKNNVAYAQEDLEKFNSHFNKGSNYIDGTCQWKNCKVSEIKETEMEDCSWNNDCENCEMNTKSDSYDTNND